MKKQRGMGMFGIFIVGVLLVLAAITTMKVVPAYIEWWSVKKVLNAMKSEPGFDDQTVRELRASFDRRAQIDDIRTINGQDLDVSKAGGTSVVSVEYSRKVHLFGNMNACMDFTATTEK